MVRAALRRRTRAAAQGGSQTREEPDRDGGDRAFGGKLQRVPGRATHGQWADGSRRKTMRATCWMGTRNVQVKTVPDPKILNPRDAIVKVTNTAICGSDVH